MHKYGCNALTHLSVKCRIHPVLFKKYKIGYECCYHRKIQLVHYWSYDQNTYELFALSISLVKVFSVFCDAIIESFHILALTGHISGQLYFNITWPRKLTAILRKTCSHLFAWTKIVVFWLKFYRILFPWIQLKLSQRRFRKWLGVEKAKGLYPSQWWPIFLAHASDTRAWWIK